MAGPVAVPLAPGVWRIPTAPMDLVNSYVFRDADGQVTLVDTGITSAPRTILAALASIGTHPSDVTRILLTHAHSDHAGGAAKLVGETGAPLAVHVFDRASVESGVPPSIDPSTRTGRLIRRVPGFHPATVSEELHDGQVIEVGGGLRVVHTPGHTPGHVSLFHEASGVLITGDAIWNVRARMTWPFLVFCSNGALTQQTAHVLGELDYRLAAFTHGPEIRDGAREAVRSFLRRPRHFRGGF